MKRKLLFAAMLIAGALGQLRAQSWEDVTSFYLTNADFEGSYSDTEAAGMQSGCKIYQPSNWTVTRVSGNEFDRTILKSTDTGASGNFTITDIHSDDRGAQTFWTRLRWGGHTWNNGPVGNSTELKISQTANLPAGKYRLSADMVFASKGNAGSNYSSLRVINSSSTQLVDEKKPTIYGTVSGNGTLSFGDPKWTNYTTDEFTLANAEDITFMGYVLQYWQNEIQAGFDNFKLERECSEASPWELPTSISNWSLNSTPWVASGVTFSYNEETYAEHFAYNTPTGDYLKYTVNNVPNGYYQVKLTAKSSSTSSRDSGNGVIAVTDGSTDYTSINSGGVEVAIPSYNAIDATTGASPAQYTLDFVYVSNNTLEVTVKINEAGPNWIIAKMDGIKFYGDIPNRKAYREALAAAQAAIANNDYDAVIGTERSDLQAEIDAAAPATTEACGTAATALETKTNAFTSAKDTYEALTREITKAKALGIETSTADGYAVTSSDNAATALSNTQALKVAEYKLVNTNYAYSVDLGAWTKTGSTGSLSSQHWSGEAREYLEQSSSNWAANSWTIKYDQNVTLPAGNYVFKVAGRQANSDGVTLSLTVKNGETTLGSVSDFPRGDKGLGITTAGVTSFDPNDTFCNTRNNNGDNLQTNGGNGWEWRYVKFTLTEDATVNVAVDAVATVEHMWVSFCDATVQTDNEANISLIAYNIALNDANTAYNNADYENVTGSEKTTLQNAIAADDNLDKTNATAIDEAKNNLVTATNAFTGAKSNYDAFEAAKAVDYPTLAYATTAKRTALDNAQAAADATSANDADTKTAAIQTAARQYYESHALAEGVTGAEDKTSLITNPDFAGVTISGTSAGAWAFDQTGGNVNINSNEPFTDGSGNSSYSYFDYYNNGSNNQNLHQEIADLEPGRYLLTATARAHANFNGNLRLYVNGKGDTKVKCIGNAGGVFDRGWNDVSLIFNQTSTGNVTIGMKTDAGKKEWWGVTRFRLVKLSDASTTLNITSASWATLYTPDALDFSEVAGLKAYTATVSESTVTLTQVNDVPANTGVVLKGAEGSYTIPWAASSETAKGDLKGNATAATAYDAADSGNAYYVLAPVAGSSNVQFQPVTSGSIPAGKAFLEAPYNPGISVKALAVVFEDATGIKAMDNEVANAEIFNLAGQRVNKAQKGIYIVNGKKVLVK